MWRLIIILILFCLLVDVIGSSTIGNVMGIDKIAHELSIMCEEYYIPYDVFKQVWKQVIKEDLENSQNDKSDYNYDVIYHEVYEKEDDVIFFNLESISNIDYQVESIFQQLVTDNILPDINTYRYFRRDPFASIVEIKMLTSNDGENNLKMNIINKIKNREEFKQANRLKLTSKNMT